MILPAQPLLVYLSEITKESIQPKQDMSTVFQLCNSEHSVKNLNIVVIKNLFPQTNCASMN